MLPKPNSLALNVLNHEKLIVLQIITGTKIRVEITLYNLKAGVLMDV
jgi:hypothetical protein